MKFWTKFKLARAYKKACKPILRERLWYTPRALKTPVTLRYVKHNDRQLATKLLRIAKSINKAALKCGSKTAICTGLAANQIGVTNQRVFVVMQKNGSFKTFINPVIIKGEEKYQTIERCFSTNFKAKKVTRFKKITVSADGLTPKRLSGIQAQTFQHEYDHLEGII